MENNDKKYKLLKDNKQIKKSSEHENLNNVSNNNENEKIDINEGDNKFKLILTKIVLSNILIFSIILYISATLFELILTKKVDQMFIPFSYYILFLVILAASNLVFILFEKHQINKKIKLYEHDKEIKVKNSVKNELRLFSIKKAMPIFNVLLILLLPVFVVSEFLPNGVSYFIKTLLFFSPYLVLIIPLIVSLKMHNAYLNKYLNEQAFKAESFSQTNEVIDSEEKIKNVGNFDEILDPKMYFMKMYFIFNVLLFGIYFILTIPIFSFGLALDSSFRGSPIEKLFEIYFYSLIVILISNLAFMLVLKTVGYMKLKQYKQEKGLKINENEKAILTIDPIKKAWISGLISTFVLTIMIIIFYLITEIEVPLLGMLFIYTSGVLTAGVITYIKKLNEDIKSIKMKI